MTELIISKIMSRIDDLPTDILKRVRNSIMLELGQYNITPKSTELVVYTGIPHLLKLFLVKKKIQGHSQRTLEEYQRKLTAFIARCGKDPKDITTEDIEMYLATREMEGLAKSSLIFL